MNTGELVLDEWQKEVLEAKGNLLLCTGRQVGKTTIFAIKAARYLINNPKSQIIIVSLTEDQAKLIIVMILDYLEKHHKAEIAKGKQKPTQNKITLKNKAVVIARPVGMTGDAVRGFTGNVLIIDEASRMPELVWAAAKPTLLTTSGEIWMCSTPHGKQGYFWKSYNNPDRYKVFHINSEQVISSRPITKTWTIKQKQDAQRLLQQEREDMSELEYGQEYLAEFLDDLRQYFPDELITKACVLKRGEFNPKKDNYLGVDIARMGGDAITYEVIHKTPDNQCYHVENIVKRKQYTTQTEKDIINIANIWNVDKVGIDAGSGALGVGIFDRLMESPIKRKIEAMNNRTISLDRDGKKKQRIFKEDMYENMLSMMESGELQLLANEDVVLSLKSVQWEIRGKPESSDTKVRIFGRDTHIAEGLVRACYLAKKRKLNKLWITCR